MPYTNFKSSLPQWRQDAANFIRRRLRTAMYYRKKPILANFRANVDKWHRNNVYNIGWSAPNAVGKARLAQYRWRKAYFLKYRKTI